MDWLNLAEQTQHCQRNWDHNKKVDVQTIDWLLDIGYTMPTKQNVSSIQIVTFTNKEQIENIVQSSIDEDMEMPSKKLLQNPQMSAPVVFLFFKKEDKKEIIRSYKKREDEEGGTTHIEIGLAAGAMALAANSKGLKTGFCRCFTPLDKGKEDNITVQILKQKGITPKDLQLGLGVGYPLTYLPSNVANNGEFYKKYKKSIQTKIII